MADAHHQAHNVKLKDKGSSIFDISEISVHEKHKPSDRHYFLPDTQLPSHEQSVVALCPVSVSMSQWPNGNMPDCGVRGPRFKSHRGQFCVYHDNHCNIQPWERAAHPYYSAQVDSAFHPPWDGIMSMSSRAE